jgi:hypothetical protein
MKKTKKVGLKALSISKSAAEATKWMLTDSGNWKNSKKQPGLSIESEFYYFKNI